MQALFPDVMFGAIGLFVLVGVLSMLTRRNLHDQIGQERLLTGERRSRGPSGDRRRRCPPTDRAPFDAPSARPKIRQMLTARSERLVRQGRGAARHRRRARPHRWRRRASDGSHDAALAEEVRQLVRARNERRARQGLDTLDVEAEVQRTLSELSP